jgi:hypothetical protein
LGEVVLDVEIDKKLKEGDAWKVGYFVLLVCGKSGIERK